MRVSQNQYAIESEIGSLFIETHEFSDAQGKTAYRSSGNFLPEKAPKERFRSARYKELEYDFAATLSYRDTARSLNRIRLQDNGATPTTVRNQTERDGIAIQETKMAKALVAFCEHGFEVNGLKKPETTIDFSKATLKTADSNAVSGAGRKLGILAQETDYEALGSAVNISVDEVCCKQQSSKRPCLNRENEPKQLRNTVVHVQYGSKGYVLAGETVQAAIRLLLGFLLTNGLLGAYPLVFFADGARNIKNTIEDYFSFSQYKYILDWPHLTKKTAELLSSAILGKDKRNEIHEKLKQFLWRGDVVQALAFLDTLPEDYIKSAKWISHLKTYLEVNRDNIPCYAIRKELGLRVSSNIGEKANDIVVSRRQKHNGMAWSNVGSFGLASVAVSHTNSELSPWLHKHSVRFAFTDANAA